MPEPRTRKLVIHCLTAAGLMTGGCATHYNKLRYDLHGIGETTFIDAKQRAVFAIPQDNGRGGWATRVCAEPSPDALSALAASGNGALSVAQKPSIQAAFAMSETASNIGLRTQSIQLMRDAMYRMCEGVASGTLSSVQFETLYRRFQNSMVTILAIEQLTGVVKGSSAQLSTNAGVGASKEIATLTSDAAKVQDAAAAADAEADKAAAALAAAAAKRDAYLKDKGGDPDKLTEDQKTKFASLQKDYTEAATANAAAVTAAATAKQKLAIYQAGMQAVHGGDLSASGTATVSGGTGGPLNTESAATIAATVQAIVTEQLDSGFFRDACATLFDTEIDGRLVSDQAQSLRAECYRYAETTVVDTLNRSSVYVENMRAQAAMSQAYARYTDAYATMLTKVAATPGKRPKFELPPPPQKQSDVIHFDPGPFMSVRHENGPRIGVSEKLPDK